MRTRILLWGIYFDRTRSRDRLVLLSGKVYKKLSCFTDTRLVHQLVSDIYIPAYRTYFGLSVDIFHIKNKKVIPRYKGKSVSDNRVSFIHIKHRENERMRYACSRR